MPATPTVEPVPVPASGRAQRLSAERCFILLARASSGHLALSQDALPLVVPVTCALDGDRLLVRARLGLIAKPLQAGIVAFQTDGTRAGDGAIWEVMVQGRAEVLDGPSVPEGPSPPPLVDGALTTALRISMDLLTGWESGGAPPEKRAPDLNGQPAT